VWIVVAKLKEGTSHIYPLRTFYFDEDSWAILMADQYDAQEKIWRVSEAHTINFYEVPCVATILMTHYDLQNGRYLAYGLYNETDAPRFDVELRTEDFSPSALRQMGRR
jgi:hypothetical protein